MTNIASQITGDATTLARTFLGLGYEKSDVERTLVRKFNLTAQQAAEVTAGITTEGSRHGS
jgi:hypothetical protein